MRAGGKLRLGALVAVLFAAGCDSESVTTLTASHQWPGGTGDIRDELVQMIARDVAAADVGLEIRVYPGESLFEARDQWPAMTRGRLDITALPLDYVSGRHPQFSATLMPGLVKDQAHAQRLNDSPFMTEIKRIIDEAGIRVLVDAWVSGGFVSSQRCILEPDDADGQVMRAAGPYFERMLVGAGASISSMPSSEIYTAMQTGVLDAANTSTTSFVSFRIYEQATCYTPPGQHTLWFMYEPVLIAKPAFEALTPAQQEALLAAAERAERFFAEEAARQDELAEQVFRDAGVEVVQMSAAQADQWRALAERTSYDVFAREVEGGRELIEKALAVE